MRNVIRFETQMGRQRAFGRPFSFQRKRVTISSCSQDHDPFLIALGATGTNIEGAVILPKCACRRLSIWKKTMNSACLYGARRIQPVQDVRDTERQLI
jgi:hypothetical protein